MWEGGKIFPIFSSGMWDEGWGKGKNNPLFSSVRMRDVGRGEGNIHHFFL